VRVELQDEAGQPLVGFALADCETRYGDEIEREVTWKGNGLSALVGKPVWVRIVMKDADVYALRFKTAQ
jgi:hypothetical protein